MLFRESRNSSCPFEVSLEFWNSQIFRVRRTDSYNICHPLYFERQNCFVDRSENQTRLFEASRYFNITQNYRFMELNCDQFGFNNPEGYICKKKHIKINENETTRLDSKNTTDSIVVIFIWTESEDVRHPAALYLNSLLLRNTRI